jgi:hypothetical protein
MRFTLSADFTCNGHAFQKGEAVELIPTKGAKLILKRKGIEFAIGPIIFNYLNEIEQPTLDVLMLWQHSLICESPTGHLVEVDGTGPDGFHSWFKYLDYL